MNFFFTDVDLVRMVSYKKIKPRDGFFEVFGRDFDALRALDLLVLGVRVLKDGGVHEPMGETRYYVLQSLPRNFKKPK